MYDIVTIGSATVDVFVKTKHPEIVTHKSHSDVCYAIGSKILISKLQFDTGGGGTNTAVAFARLGLKTGWIGILGKDPNSHTVQDMLETEKIKFLGIKKTGTTGYSVILTGVQNDRTILAYKGINDELKKKDLKTPKTKWFYVSAMRDTSLKTTEQIIKQAKKKKIPYAFNPSLYLASLGIKRLKTIVQGCKILILNLEEARALLSSTDPVPKLLQELSNYAEIAIITDGKKGAYAIAQKEKYYVKPLQVKVVETTGAGDSFAAGVVAGLLQGKKIETALAYGAAESSSVIQHVGAKTGLLNKVQLRKIARKVKIQKC